MTQPPKKAQLQLPGLVVSDGQEHLDIASHKLADLETQMASEERCITVLTV